MPIIFKMLQLFLFKGLCTLIIFFNKTALVVSTAACLTNASCVKKIYEKIVLNKIKTIL